MTAAARTAGRVGASLRGGGAQSWLILAIGVAGGVLLIVAELRSVVTIDVLTTGTCEEIADPAVRDACDVSGLEQHGGAFILLGVLAVLMAIGAGRGASRAAAGALLVIAVVVAGFTVLRDIPQAGETGLVGIRYEQAEASWAGGLYLQIAGLLLCALAGAARLGASALGVAGRSEQEAGPPSPARGEGRPGAPRDGDPDERAEPTEQERREAAREVRNRERAAARAARSRRDEGQG